MWDPQRVFWMSGTVLFLIGLLSGAGIQACKNPRMGLSAHLAGVQNAMVLWIFGFLVPHVDLSSAGMRFFAGSSIYGLVVIWFAIQLAAAWGASRSLPIAGKGYQASPGQERVVTSLLMSGSLATIAGTVALLVGLA